MNTDIEVIEEMIESIKADFEKYSESVSLKNILFSYYFNTNYEVIHNRYRVYDIESCQLKTEQDLKRVFGYDIKCVKGFESLSTAYKSLFIKLLCRYLNGVGLQNRERRLATRVKLEEKQARFKIYLLNKKDYSYLDFDGTYY